MAFAFFFQVAVSMRVTTVKWPAFGPLWSNSEVLPFLLNYIKSTRQIKTLKNCVRPFAIYLSLSCSDCLQALKRACLINCNLSVAFQGISFSSLMYVTKRNMANAVASMTKHLEQVQSSLAVSTTSIPFLAKSLSHFPLLFRMNEHYLYYILDSSTTTCTHYYCQMDDNIFLSEIDNDTLHAHI